MKVYIDTVMVAGKEKGKLYLESYEKGFVLKEYNGKINVDKNGRETEVYIGHGYFTNVHYALKGFLKMKIMQSTATTLRELQLDIANIRKYIEKVLPE